MSPREKKMWSEVLKLYRNNSCLWNKSDENYKDRYKRKKSYEELLVVFKTFYENGNIVNLKRKLENFRSTFKRQYKKIRKAEMNGRKINTTLWYYDKLLFLLKSGNINFKDSETYTHFESLEDYEDCSNDSNNANHDETSIDRNEDSDIEMDQPIESVMYNEEYIPEDPFDKSPSHRQKEAAAFGKAIGMQLCELEPTQRYIAEKLISDTIFLARFHRLTEDSSINLRDAPESSTVKIIKSPSIIRKESPIEGFV